MINYKKTNLNYYIKVKLTADGINAIYEHYGYDFPINIDSDGYTEFQMWDFARIFGGRMGMTLPLVCATNVLIQVEE